MDQAASNGDNSVKVGFFIRHAASPHNRPTNEGRGLRNRKDRKENGGERAKVRRWGWEKARMAMTIRRRVAAVRHKTSPARQAVVHRDDGELRGCQRRCQVSCAIGRILSADVFFKLRH